MEAKDISALVLERNQLRDKILILISDILRLDTALRNARSEARRLEYSRLLRAKQIERDAVMKRQAEVDTLLIPEGIIAKSRIEKIEYPKPKAKDRTMPEGTKRFLENLRRKPK